MVPGDPPWRWLTDQHPLVIGYRPADPPRYAVVIGSGGAVFGLAVYDTWADLQRLYQSPLSPKQLAQLVTWCVLFFEEATAMSFEDLDAMAQYDWPVAAPQAYPVFGRTTPTQEIVLPTTADLLWMEGALAGLVAYVATLSEQRHGGVPPADVTFVVPLVGGEAPVQVTRLGLDTVWPRAQTTT